MAKNGKLSKTVYGGLGIPLYYIYFEWETTSQSIANNTSTVKWKCYAKGFDEGETVVVQCYLDDEWYSDAFTVEDESVYPTLENTTVFTHDADGSKTITVSFRANHTGATGGGISGGSGSGTMTLDALDGRSTLTAANGTLDEEQTLTVTPKRTGTTHKITYTCNSVSGEVCEETSDTEIYFTPTLDLASQNTTGTTVSITYTIKTLQDVESENEDGETVVTTESVGSRQIVVTYAIPESVKPSCAVSVEESTNYATKYGGYLQGLSKLAVKITETIAYDSAITSYRTNCDNVSYIGNDITTEVIKNSGTITVSSAVTDGRGRSGSASKDVSFIPYSKPRVSSLTVHRCLVDGTEDDQGAYVKVTFSASITSLSNINTAAYVLSYKKTSETDYTDVNLTAYNNVYTIDGAEYIFLADDSSSYNVVITATDDFYTVKNATSASTAYTIMHFGADGQSVGVGKLAEKTGVLDIGYITRHYGGFEYRVLEDSSDADAMTTPNIYAISAEYTYTNMPASGVNAIFEVIASANIQIQQFTVISSGASKVYERVCVAGAWTNWLSPDAGGITKEDVEAVLTGNITTHTHSQYLTSHQDISGKLNKSGGTLTGAVTAHTGTDYTTYRVRNIALKTAAETPSNGAILGVYEA